MKKTICIAFFAGAILLALQAYRPMRTAKKDGAEPGYTGSPGDSFKNCTFCHGGNAEKVTGWITSNIPSSGYVPGQTYTITTTNTENFGTRFGFQISPQDSTGKLLGEIIVTDAVQTKLVGSSKYITYTENGVDGNGSKTWTFDWKAPAAGTGLVTFYGGFNSNFNGHKDGDKTFLSTLTVAESGPANVADLPPGVKVFRVFPNPAGNNITVHLELKETSKLTVDILDNLGRKVANICDVKCHGVVTKQYNTSALTNGNYFVQMQWNGKTYRQQIAIVH